MAQRTSVSLAFSLAAACALATSAAALAAEPAAASTAAAAPADDASVVTVAALRSIGAGMFNWLTHQADVPMTAMEPDLYDWSDCAPISHEDARAILVPEFVSELPRTDGWGHPLELCLWRPGHPRGHLMGVRSPGRDGVFEGSEHRAAAFPPAEADHDLVWMDGYFVSWPEAPAP